MSLIFDPIEESVGDVKLKCLLYGPPGVGKSTLSVSSGLPTVVGSTEIKQTNLALTYAKARGVVHPNTSKKGLNSIADLESFYNKVAANIDKIGVIVLDNLTGIQELIYKQIQGSAGLESSMNYDGWRSMRVRLFDWVAKFRDLDAHVIFIAHYMEYISEEQGKYVRPQLMGKDTGVWVASELNLVGYMYNRMEENKVKREIMFQGSNNLLLKGNPMLDNVEPADLKTIIAKATKSE